MPRELWAKLAIEIRTDPKLLVRPEWERLFWVNLILLAKEKTDDGVLAGYTPSILRTLCAIRAQPTAIRDALNYFQSVGMVALTQDSITLTHFVKRQGQYDAEEEREKWRERKRRQRDKLDKSNGVTAGQAGQSHDVPPLEESRGEEKRLEEIPLKPPQGGATQVSHPFRRKAEPPAPLPKWKQQGASSPEEYERWLSEAKADQHGT